VYGSIFSLLGIWIQRLTIGWHAWLLSESAFIVGLVSAVQFLPVVFLTPFFGVLVDRIKAQSGSVVMNILMGIIAVLLGVITLQGHMTIEILGGLALAHGVIVSFWTPTRMALIPDLVPTRLFPSAFAISAIVFNLCRFAGPALAGFVIAAWGMGWAYVVNATTYLPVILSLLLLRIDHDSKVMPEKRPYFEQLKEGINYTRTHKTIRLAILLALAGAFFGRSVLELMPAFAALVFHGGSNALALLMSGAGAGALIGSFAMSSTRLQMRLQPLIILGCAGVTASLAMFGATDNIYVGVLSVALLGLFSTFVGVGSQSLVQVRVENRLRGRVMSLWTLVGMGGPAVGSVLGGVLIRDFGATFTSWFYGFCCLLLVVLFARGQIMRAIVSSS
jgi:MFS family permease